MSTQPVDITPASIDYTTRDYYSIRDTLIERIKLRIPNWTASDPADFGVALVEAFSYMGDLLSYYIDRAANESFVETAIQRSTLLHIAETYGYTPSGYRQAYVTLIFSNSSDSAVTLPIGSVVYAEVSVSNSIVPVYFTTLLSALIPANGTVTVSAYEGRPVKIVADNANEFGELIGSSSGLTNQQFTLGETPVAEGTIEIYVQDGSTYTKWTSVKNLIDYGPTDLVYTPTLDDNNSITITFGDGVSGVIPTYLSQIRANYVVGGGTIGNIKDDLGFDVFNLFYVPGLSESELTALQSIVDVNNDSAGIGGEDVESNDQIRISAPETLRALNRAITLKDFERLALSIAGIGKAKASSTIWTNVTLYIAPSKNEGTLDQSPGVDEESNTTTAEFDRLKTELETFLSDKTLIGTTVTVSPPVYTDLVLDVEYTKRPQYTTAEIEDEIKRAIFIAFGYTRMNFADVIPPQYVEYVLLQVPGIETAVVNILDRADAVTPAKTTVTGAAGEIFRFVENEITLTDANA